MSVAETNPSHHHVKKRFSQGLATLLLRQILFYGSVFLGNIFLTRLLTQEVYGIFVAMLALQTTLSVFSDIGLGAALIQRNSEPTPEEIASLFSLQFSLCILTAVVAWFLAPLLVSKWNLDIAVIALIRSMGIIFVLTALRSILAMMLERELRFDAIALAEVTGMVVYQTVVVVLVWWGLGISSMIWALLARHIIDLGIVFANHPWKPRFNFRYKLVLPYLRFGITMQGVKLLAYMKDNLPTLFMVPFMGALSTGQWGWALTYIGIPVYFSRLVDRLVFPTYSRVQNDRKALGEILTLAIWVNFAVGLPILIILNVFASDIIPLVYGEVWTNALMVVYLLTPNMIGGFITGVILPLLFATNQQGLIIKVFLVWISLITISTFTGFWLRELAVLAIGYSIATLLISISMINIALGFADLSLKSALRTPLISSGITLITILALQVIHINMWPLEIVITLITYTICFLLLDGQRLYTFLRGY